MGLYVTADPDTRIIDITKVPVSGLSSLDVVDDIYEALKEDWLNTPALQPLVFPFRSFGDPKSPTTQIGPYVFIDNANGWRIRPYDVDHELTLIGNLIPEDVTQPLFLNRAGRTITIVSEQSAQALTTSGADVAQIEANTDLTVKLLEGKTITDPVTGKMYIHDTDDSVLRQADIFEDAAGVTPYGSTSEGIERRERLAAP